MSERAALTRIFVAREERAARNPGYGRQAVSHLTVMPAQEGIQDRGRDVKPLLARAGNAGPTQLPGATRFAALNSRLRGNDEKGDDVLVPSTRRAPLRCTRVTKLPLPRCRHNGTNAIESGMR